MSDEHYNSIRAVAVVIIIFFSLAALPILAGKALAHERDKIYKEALASGNALRKEDAPGLGDSFLLNGKSYTIIKFNYLSNGAYVCRSSDGDEMEMSYPAIYRIVLNNKRNQSKNH